MHPLIKAELDSLQRQFGNNKEFLTLNEYADFYGISRRNASRHLRRKNIPSIKDGKSIHIPILDFAKYRAKCKAENNKALLIDPVPDNEMKRRRGFNQMAERRQLSI